MNIQDDYRNLKFKKVTNISQIKIGMMVQYVENQHTPLKWTWKEVDEKMLLMLNSKKENLQWVRLPDYA